jgi:hypothetical protein
MKNISFVASFLASSILIGSACFASVCEVTGSNGGFWQDGKSRVQITCDRGNPDTQTIVEPDGDPDTLFSEVLTAVNYLLKKGYKVVSQVNTVTYTLAK